jgi:hypothetical protein
MEFLSSVENPNRKESAALGVLLFAWCYRTLSQVQRSMAMDDG